MAAIQIDPQLQPALERLQGKTFDEKLARLIASELRRYLAEVEHEALEFEIKYGVDYAQFVAKLEHGELGDPFGYALEQDAMRWEGLVAEKKNVARATASGRRADAMKEIVNLKF